MPRKYWLFLGTIFFILLIYKPVLCQWRYHIHDHLGNTRVVLDDNGDVKEYYDYYPFGMTQRENITGSAPARHKFTGKELDEESDLGWYYFGARYYDPEIGRFLSVDRFADKYPSLTPYQYCANNPLKFIDINGDSIWINYTDSNGDAQKLLYSAGMTYNGNNSSVAGLISKLNSISSVGIGSTVLSRLIGSTGNYNFSFGTLADADAGGQFIGKSGGLGGDFTLDPKKDLSVGGLAHETFHAYQHDFGSGGSSIFNEIQATLFGEAVGLSTGNIGGMFGNLSTQAGRKYENAMQSLLFSSNFNQTNFNTALNNFSKGSIANLSGLYSRYNYPLKRKNQLLLIKSLYPLLR